MCLDSALWTKNCKDLRLLRMQQKMRKDSAWDDNDLICMQALVPVAVGLVQQVPTQEYPTQQMLALALTLALGLVIQQVLGLARALGQQPQQVLGLERPMQQLLALVLVQQVAALVGLTQ